MQRAEPTPESEEMGARMAGNFDLFIAHEVRHNAGYVPDIDALRSGSTRIVSAAGETSGDQRHDAPQWRYPEEFAERLHEALREA